MPRWFSKCTKCSKYDKFGASRVRVLRRPHAHEFAGTGGQYWGWRASPMHVAAEIIREAAELPVEERALVIDSLLRTLNRPDSEIDRQWVAVARRRLEELRSGAVRSIPGADVFSRIRDRFTG